MKLHYNSKQWLCRVSFHFQLPFIFPSESLNLDQLDDARSGSQRGMGDQENSVIVKLVIKLVEGVHLNEEAPNSWKLFSEGNL